jgi:hypothetical protein
MQVSFQAQRAWQLRKQDLVQVDDQEYTVVEVSFALSGSTTLIVAIQHGTGHTVELLVKQDNVMTVCGPYHPGCYRDAVRKVLHLQKQQLQQDGAPRVMRYATLHSVLPS